MKKVSVINFKGGVGKTTLSFHLACHLAESHRVLVVDVDHQSSLSLLILRSTLWQRQIDENKTINRIFESFCNRRLAPATDDIIIKNPLSQRDRRYNRYPNLDLVSAQFEIDDTEIDLASTNYGNSNISDWEKRTLLASWLDSIEAEKHYDYVIFDCPPATKIVSQNALSCSNCYVIPVIPDELSSRGVSHFQGLVSRKIDDKLKYLKETARITPDNTPQNYIADTKMAAIAPFLVRVAGNAASGYVNIHTEQLAALRTQWGSAVLRTVGENQTGIPEAVNSGWPIWYHSGQNARWAVKAMMTNICTELKERIDAT